MTARRRPPSAKRLPLCATRRSAGCCCRLGAGADLSRRARRLRRPARRLPLAEIDLAERPVRCRRCSQFLAIEGVFNALLNSLIAAGLTVLFSIAARRAGRLRAGALRLPRPERLPPARAPDPRLPARHPGAAAHRLVHPLRALRHAVRRLARSTRCWRCPSPRSSRRACSWASRANTRRRPGSSAARGLQAFLQGGAAAGAAGPRGDRDLRLRDLLERGFRRLDPDRARAHAHRLSADRSSPRARCTTASPAASSSSCPPCSSSSRSGSYLFAVWGIASK